MAVPKPVNDVWNGRIWVLKEGEIDY